MEKIYIVAGGPERLLPDLQEANNEEITWVGVDRGVIYLAERHLPMAEAIGDFDSITAMEREELQSRHRGLKIFPSDKDKTDTELAVDWAISRKPGLIRIYGATGGRLDHFFANIYLLMKQFESSIPMELEDSCNFIKLLPPGQHVIKEDDTYPYISFVPVASNVEGLTLEGFKYPLENRHIPFGSTLCISNELIHHTGTVSFAGGILMMIRSRDETK
ncbi:thiamine diphosphokinase [Bacillus sp. FJAT-42376]|uniref:thiamine diphosphokinase n=1 Tax=Bacillus sp. FJAT-42376 TaxID=2014076 RepID=UPI000F4DE53E|nr:thiamine diphosphokinase [Bacillus sp. FJAT-42376]AZB42896.1 thiamine diphosphokinase [Bacillus sp. FJAT-42376]